MEKMAVREFDWVQNEVKDERAAVEPIRQCCHSHPCLSLGTMRYPRWERDRKAARALLGNLKE